MKIEQIQQPTSTHADGAAPAGAVVYGSEEATANSGAGDQCRRREVVLVDGGGGAASEQACARGAGAARERSARAEEGQRNNGELR